jgi:DNA ligase D-like protein (predicted ligase)
MTLPQTLQPMLAVASEPYDADDHFFEIKWDGIRCLSFCDKETRLQSRNLRDLTSRFPELAQIHSLIAGSKVLLDGEIITFLNGKPSFLSLQPRIHARTKSSIYAGMAKAPAVYIVFDLLYLNGQSLLEHPLEERRDLLTRIVSPGQIIQLSEVTRGQGVALFAAAKSMGLEGIVGKDKNSIYLPGKRSKKWRKVKAVRHGYFLICGYTKNPTGRHDLSALALAIPIEQKYGYFGLVGTGLSQNEIDHLLSILTPLSIREPPRFSWPIKSPSGICWVEPKIVCEVEYLELTSDHHLRHPLYLGLRSDKEREDCTIG